jgi:hypothetical protein
MTIETIAAVRRVKQLKNKPVLWISRTVIMLLQHSLKIIDYFQGLVGAIHPFFTIPD